MEKPSSCLLEKILSLLVGTACFRLTFPTSSDSPVDASVNSALQRRLLSTALCL